ncbi:MAG: RNA 2',3'-cyclic phosphodiesterase [Pseudomonadota bacterium]|nr:RNA 2',3'-cyclic phosphodiesterase [Pseudomonadota bacterium]
MQPDLLGGVPAQALQRLFFALLPDTALRARIAETAANLERSRGSGGRLLKPERYHLTLQFLGDFQPLPPALVAAARAAGDATPMQAFDLVLDHAGSFPGSRVWWLGGQPSDALQALWEGLGTQLLRAGARPQRGAFTPHVTLVRDARRQIEPMAIDPLHWRVGGFALVESRPGQPYDILQRWGAG